MKRIRLSHFVKAIGFFTLGMALLLYIQHVLSQKWNYPVISDSSGEAMDEFYQLADTAEIQAVFVGTSFAELGIDPMAIYDSTGIASFNLASSVQPAPGTYFMCAEALERHNPKVVFLEVGKLFHDNFEEFPYRIILDNAAFSRNKVELAMEYASHYPESKQAGAFFGAFFPIYRYHDRWKELSKYDFELVPERAYYRKGYYLTDRISPCGVTQERMNEEAELLYGNSGWTQSIIDGTAVNDEENDRLYDPDIGEVSLSYLKAMKELCERHGAKLMLIKIPSIGDPQYRGEAWTRIQSDVVKKLAAELDLDYLDLLYDVDLGLDWERDTYDGGIHMNVQGAAKISAYLADYLRDVCGLAGTVCGAYEQDLPLYHTMRQTAALQMETYLADYLDRLGQLDNATVFLSASDDMMSNLLPWDREALKAFGLQTDFDSMSYSDSFLAVKENGKVCCEMSSNRRIAYGGVLECGYPYSISSCGWLVGMESKISVNGTDYSLNHRGLNIVVLDNESGLVLDSVAFDTWAPPDNQAAIRDNSKTEVFLREYEQYLMERDARNGIGV